MHAYGPSFYLRVTPLRVRQLHSLLGQAPAKRNGHIAVPIFNLARELAPLNFNALTLSAFLVLCIVTSYSVKWFRVQRLSVNSNDEFRV
ncbi:hypothetical protein VNO77_32488 [Canavalia gladiata]|uniref:Uncharacterized protein n=1 Tax=Canavalia gladiata TaxID=3824 RepID=A0AAN9Q540_CANGL